LAPLASFHVRLVNDNTAAIYESSSFAAVDLKDYSRLVRRAAALGRACAEPLAVLCALMSPQDELLALQLDPLQGMVPIDMRKRALEHLLVTAVAQVGVSINECVQKDWLAPMLHFVPGLGPRKAQHLIRVCSQTDRMFDTTNGV
jgi:transcription elongation factor SPT6